MRRLALTAALLAASALTWALCSPPTLTFTATPTAVPAGSASTLNWSTTDATSCTRTGSWSGLSLASGFASVAPGTYSLTCVGPAGSVAKSVTVAVGAPPPPSPVPPTVTLAATPSSLVSGNQAALTWTSTNANGCTASGAWSGPKATASAESSPPLTATSTFTLTCVGPAGTAASTASVTVTQPPPPPTGTSGWQQLPGTTIRAVCPPDNFGGTTYAFKSFCTSVVNAWNSAVFDSKRNRLVIWGGGHNDYYGNEVYALNLSSPATMQRLNDPSPFSTASPCSVVAQADGSSKARHTYDGIAYLPAQDKMFVHGGAVSCLAGGITNDTWLFDFTTMKWQQMMPTGAIPNPAPGTVTAFDSVTGRVFLHTDWNLYSYDPAANAYQQHANNNAIDYHMTAVVDPVRRKFIVIGGGQAWSYDLTTYTRTALNMTGALPIRSASYPGLAYHPPTGNVVAWAGGDTIYTLNPAGTWSATTYPNGPGPAQGNGTYKRWNYSPAAGAFVLVNSVDQNAFTFRP